MQSFNDRFNAYNGLALRHLIEAGCLNLGLHIPELDAGYIFSLHHTGTHMFLALEAACTAMREYDVHKPSVGKIANIAAHAAMMNARGNEGIGISWWLHGFAASLGDKQDMKVEDFVHALVSAAEALHRCFIPSYRGLMAKVASDAAEAAFNTIRSGSNLSLAIQVAAATARSSTENSRMSILELRQLNMAEPGASGYAYFLEGMEKGLHSSQDESKDKLQAIHATMYNYEPYFQEPLREALYIEATRLEVIVGVGRTRPLEPVSDLRAILHTAVTQDTLQQPDTYQAVLDKVEQVTIALEKAGNPFEIEAVARLADLLQRINIIGSERTRNDMFGRSVDAS